MACISPHLSSALGENHMKYISTIDSATNICTLLIRGQFRRPEDADEMKHFAVKIRAQHGCRRFLFDMREAEILGGTMDILAAASPQGDLADSLRQFKVAVLVPHINDDEHFFETVAVNRGFQLHTFDDLDKGVEWLSG
jgi:hypothetical protein